MLAAHEGGTCTELKRLLRGFCELFHSADVAAGGHPARTQAAMSSGKKRGDAPMRTCGTLPGSEGVRVSADQSQRGERRKYAAHSRTVQRDVVEAISLLILRLRIEEHFHASFDWIFGAGPFFEMKNGQFI